MGSGSTESDLKPGIMDVGLEPGCPGPSLEARSVKADLGPGTSREPRSWNLGPQG